MKARRTARRLALDVLYEAEIRGALPLETYEERQQLGWYVATDPGDAEAESSEPPGEDSLSYARSIVAGVQSRQADLDELIARYADRWTVERMPLIDRNLLRMALWELLYGDAIPVAVAINEAVELAKAFSTDDSGRFINGLLGRIVEESSELEDPPSPEGTTPGVGAG